MCCSSHPPLPCRELDAGFGGRLTGYVNWSLSSFTLDKLLDGAFPTYAALQLDLYNALDEVEPDPNDEDEDVAYLPFIDFDCMADMADMGFTTYNSSMRVDVTVDVNNGTDLVPFNVTGLPLQYWRDFTTSFFDGTDGERENLSAILLNAEARDTSPTSFGPCFNNKLTCRLLRNNLSTPPTSLVFCVRVTMTTSSPY